ncbi:MAG: methyl-accepting chemotaxis protein [Maritimibacter sp.]
MKQDTEINTGLPVDPRLSGLSKHSAALGFEIVEVAGFIDQVDSQTNAQIKEIAALSDDAQVVLQTNRNVREALEGLAGISEELQTIVTNSVDLVQSGTARSQDIAEWVQTLAAQMPGMTETLDTVQSSNGEIASIAAQVNILAINAKIEAARAGDAGRGFAVVANAINELSGKTARAAEQISEQITNLTNQVATLARETKDVAEKSTAVLAGTAQIDHAMTQIADGASDSAAKVQATQDNAAQVRDRIEHFLPAFEKIRDSSRTTAEGVHTVSARVHSLVDRSETMVRECVTLGGGSEDMVFIERVQRDAARIEAAFEEAVARREITLAQLFDQHYQPIPGTNPEQMMAPYTRICDKLLPPIQEDAAVFDQRVVFCAAVDKNGYLPTHNNTFSQPQGNDPVWNAANSRNRRIFDDRVGLKAGQSTAPFLLQVYRRDMGGGNFVLMKDLSAPISVQGRHWGGLRLAYKLA